MLFVCCVNWLFGEWLYVKSSDEAEGKKDIFLTKKIVKNLSYEFLGAERDGG